uniref:helix-turn-helix domain-containing protein n=1 Tax=uncultured Draconibacterium sp. TaxID=1573823 RepID=UPI0032162C4F
MLQYNFSRIFKAKGIERPFSFLRKAGFSDNFATKVKNNRVRRLELKEMEKLCLLLKCTPNDFMQWIPENQYVSDTEHPLNEIRHSTDSFDLIKTINSLPLSRISEVNEIIQRELKNR